MDITVTSRKTKSNHTIPCGENVKGFQSTSITDENKVDVDFCNVRNVVSSYEMNPDRCDNDGGKQENDLESNRGDTVKGQVDMDHVDDVVDLIRTNQDIFAYDGEETLNKKSMHPKTIEFFRQCRERLDDTHSHPDSLLLSNGVHNDSYENVNSRSLMLSRDTFNIPNQYEDSDFDKTIFVKLQANTNSSVLKDKSPPKYNHLRASNTFRLIKTPRLKVTVEGSIIDKPFPLLVYDMIVGGDLVKWTHNGAAFKFVSGDEKSLETMREQFSLPKDMRMFRRKLYHYGWRKYDDSFFHPKFHKDIDLAYIALLIRTDSLHLSESCRIRKKGIDTLLPSFEKSCDENKSSVITYKKPSFLTSPITHELSVTTRYGTLPFSPIEHTLETCQEMMDNKTFSFDMSDLESSYFIETKFDQDDISKISIPVTPLTINTESFY